MSCKANERHITFEEGCWTFHPNSVYHSVMLLYLQEERVSCQCTFGSRLREEREKVNSLCECSEGSFLTQLNNNHWLSNRQMSLFSTSQRQLMSSRLTCLLLRQLCRTHRPVQVSASVPGGTPRRQNASYLWPSVLRDKCLCW